MSRIAALAALVLLCFPALADGAAAARLGALLAGMQRIEASFSQRLLDEQGESMQESSGRVLIAHPGRFRWETTAPFEQLVVSDGSGRKLAVLDLPDGGFSSAARAGRPPLHQHVDDRGERRDSG